MHHIQHCDHVPVPITDDASNTGGRAVSGFSCRSLFTREVPESGDESRVSSLNETEADKRSLSVALNDRRASHSHLVTIFQVGTYHDLERGKDASIEVSKRRLIGQSMLCVLLAMDAACCLNFRSQSTCTPRSCSTSMVFSASASSWYSSRVFLLPRGRRVHLSALNGSFHYWDQMAKVVNLACYLALFIKRRNICRKEIILWQLRPGPP